MDPAHVFWRLFFALFLLSSSVRAQLSPAEKPDPIIGDWVWFNGGVVTFESGGTTSGRMKGTWAFTNNKEVERKYTLKWENAVEVDTVSLARDGNRLTGRNNRGHSVGGERVRNTPSAVVKKPIAFSPLAHRTLKGTFYVSVDDSAKLYVNGVKVHEAGLNESRSKELELKTGDAILIRLDNAIEGHRFKVTFVASDDREIVNFRAKDFVVPPDPRIRTFTAEEFATWGKRVRQERHGNRLPVKSASDWVWTDTEDGVIACIVTPDMFSAAIR